MIIRIDPGAVDRLNDLFIFPFKPKQYFSNWQDGISQITVSQIDKQREINLNVPCQFDPFTRQLSWMTGNMKAGEPVYYQISMSNANEITPKKYSIEQKPAHLLIKVDGEVFSRYNYLGVWKPYFWPLNGSHGTVVRGAGGDDHPHHTGLYMSYGGHGEGGSANIWSDWDEPPYGPCGKMLHQRFIHISEGPIYAEFIEDVIYVKGNGDIILDERRIARAWYTNNGARFLDLYFETTHPVDIGKRIFMLVARIAPSMKIPKEGHVENSEGIIGRSEIHHKKARWCDFSGKVGEGINGICIFDHPQNPEYPGFWGEIAVPSQITLLHHPPDELLEDRFRLKFRVYVHDGNTADASIEKYYENYISPIKGFEHRT